MDGTLLIDHETIHPNNVKAIHRAMEQGARFVVASGRTVASCRRVLAAHALHDIAVIGANGGEISDHEGFIVEQHFMDSELARKTLRIYSENGLHACLCSEKGVVYPTAEAMERIAGRTAEASKYGENAIQDALVHPYKTACIKLAGQESAFEAARNACERLPGIQITSSWHNNFEAMPTGVSKGAALRRLAARLDICADEVLAFGDGENDLSMLAYVGFGYVMGNAQADIIAKAKYVTGRNDQAGVAQGIARFF